VGQACQEAAQEAHGQEDEGVEEDGQELGEKEEGAGKVPQEKAF
jgi:hypothetical protein